MKNWEHWLFSSSMQNIYTNLNLSRPARPFVVSSSGNRSKGVVPSVEQYLWRDSPIAPWPDVEWISKKPLAQHTKPVEPSSWGWWEQSDREGSPNSAISTSNNAQNNMPHKPKKRQRRFCHWGVVSWPTQAVSRQDFNMASCPTAHTVSTSNVHLSSAAKCFYRTWCAFILAVSPGERSQSFESNTDMWLI